MPDAAPLVKSPTGITGFDQMTGGGLPHSRTTVLAGAPGAGKTVFAVQSLAANAAQRGHAGIFVGFEEPGAQVLSNYGSFGWNLPALIAAGKLALIDGRQPSDVICTGEFTLAGLLAAVQVKAQAMQATHVVFDSIDLLLNMLDSPRAQKREIYRIHDWLSGSGMTGLMTVRTAVDSTRAMQLHTQLEFMADCTIAMQLDLRGPSTHRSIRVCKYRGSRYCDATLPLLITSSGIQVHMLSDYTPPSAYASLQRTRVSTGMAALDALLGGGYFRGASVWISGAPGTGKSALAAAFAHACCQRGEATLLVCFDQDGAHYLADMAALGLPLRDHMQNGLLILHCIRSVSRSMDAHLWALYELHRKQGATHIALDGLPVGRCHRRYCIGFAEQLQHHAREHGATLLCTAASLGAADGGQTRVPAMAAAVDFWIALSYAVAGGRRYRELAVIKARGTAHTDTIHELVLSSAGVAITPLDLLAAEAATPGTHHE